MIMGSFAICSDPCCPGHDCSDSMTPKAKGGWRTDDIYLRECVAMTHISALFSQKQSG